MTDAGDADGKMPLEHYRSLAALEGSYWWHQTRYRLACGVLRRHRPEFPALSVADVGCGTGGFLHHLLASGVAEPRGFDFSIPIVPVDKQIDIRPIDLETSFELPAAPYDVITSLDVLEHLRDESGFLRAARSNLRPKGILLLTLPAHQFLFSEWDRKLKHFRRYSKTDLRTTLEANGFSVLESSYFFSFVFPIALFRTWTGTFDGREACEFPQVPSMLNRILLALGLLELSALRVLPMPVGTSVYALAERNP